MGFAWHLSCAVIAPGLPDHFFSFPLFNFTYPIELSPPTGRLSPPPHPRNRPSQPPSGHLRHRLLSHPLHPQNRDQRGHERRALPRRAERLGRSDPNEHDRQATRQKHADLQSVLRTDGIARAPVRGLVLLLHSVCVPTQLVHAEVH